MTFDTLKKPGPPCVHDPAASGPTPCPLCVHHLGRLRHLQSIADEDLPNSERILKHKLERLDKFIIEMLEWAHEKQKEGDLWAATQILDMMRRSTGEPEWTNAREAIRQRLLSIAIIAVCAFSVGFAVAFAICTATGR